MQLERTEFHYIRQLKTYVYKLKGLLTYLLTYINFNRFAVCAMLWHAAVLIYQYLIDVIQSDH